MKEYRIDEICEVIAGGTPSTKIASYWDGDIVWLTPKDLSNNNSKWISNSLISITEDGLKNSSARMLPVNAVLLSSRAPIGYLALSGAPLCTNQGFKSMVCDERYILPEYLYYLLQTKVEDLNNISTGSTFKELSASLLKNYKIIVHELDEQRHIVDILGSIDNSIENNEGEIKKINDFALFLISQTDNKKTALKPYIKFIKGKKPVQNGTEKADYLSIEGITSSIYEQAFVDGMIMATAFDILMVMDGASSGTVFSHQNGIVSSTLAKIETPADMNDYIYWFLLSMKDTIKTRNTGSAIPHANKDYISSLMIDVGMATNDVLRVKLHTLRERIISLNLENIKLRELKQLYLKKFFG